MFNDNFINFIVSLCFAVCPVIPFAITDIYYGYHSYKCMDINIINNLNIQSWILINGYMSLSSILFISFIFFFFFVYFLLSWNSTNTFQIIIICGIT